MSDMSDGEDTLAAVLDDADFIFHYEKGERPQDRAHRYLEEHRVARGFSDTAMLCAAQDLVRRAHALGVHESKSGMARALLHKCAGELLESAERLG